MKDPTEWENCNRCGNFGILRAIVNGGEQETLVYCDCDWLKLEGNVWRLPKINRHIASAFCFSKCPLAWFLPDNERGRVPRGQMIASMQPLVERWKSRVRDAESFWDEQGVLFGKDGA